MYRLNDPGREVPRLAAIAVAASLGLAAFAATATAGILSSDDERHYRAAFEAAERGAWDRAHRFAARGDDPLPRKMLTWLHIVETGADHSFGQIAGFLAANPDWPRRAVLLRRAEETMTEATPDRVVLDWFGEREPQTANGMVRLAEAMIDSGRADEAPPLLRRAWIEGGFGAKEEKSFLKRYGKLLNQDDHWARLDRLLWEGSHDQARRMMPRVDAGRRALAEARIRLRRTQGGVDAAINRIPASLIDDAGFQYERARWRRKKGRDDEAAKILANPPDKVERPDLWWDESALVIRRVLAAGSVSDAYRLARNRGAIEGTRLADAEWLAGWIALRFLDDHAVALAHFVRMGEAVRTPISRARAAYWAGRAAERMGDLRLAFEWYAAASEHGWTFYGQLAANRIGRGHDRAMPAEPATTDADTAAFEKSDLARAATIAAEFGRDDLVRAFLVQSGQAARSTAERALAGRHAVGLGRRDIGVVVARDAYRDGHPLPDVGFPVIKLPKGGIEPALLHGIMRQESNFDIAAESVAGARGLMQLIPATARYISRILKIGYSADRLTKDEDYNVTLGQAYLAELLGNYGGSYVLALAAYNAGPGNVQRWLRLNGDPRQSGVDAVDWMEMIPFEETRNYVQRVLENTQVYRWRMGASDGGPERRSIEADLARGASQPRS